MKIREVKSKGEKERYKHLNAEFQRIATRDEKAFLSDQCKEIEENNRMGKTRDLFKKIRDTKGTFHAKMGSIKDRNGTELTEAEDIKKRWQEYTEELYKKDLHDRDNHDGVITNVTAVIKKTKHRLPKEHMREAPNSSPGNQRTVSISRNQLGKAKAREIGRQRKRNSSEQKHLQRPRVKQGQGVLMNCMSLRKAETRK